MNEMITKQNTATDLAGDQSENSITQYMVFGGSFKDAGTSMEDAKVMPFLGWFNSNPANDLVNGEAVIPCGQYAGCNTFEYAKDKDSTIYIMVILYNLEDDRFVSSTTKYTMSLCEHLKVESKPTGGPTLLKSGYKLPLKSMRMSRDSQSTISPWGQGYVLQATTRLCVNNDGSSYCYFTEALTLNREEIKNWRSQHDGSMFEGTYEISGIFEVQSTKKPYKKGYLKFDPRVRVGPPFG